MIGVSLVGVDGSQWDLRRGQIVLGPGAEGFGLPKFDRPTTESPARDGQQLQGTGSRALARSGILPMIMQEQATDLAWLALQRAWWAAWSPDLPCLLSVTDPAGAVRSLKVFLDSDDGYSLDDEPSLALFERLPTSWIADDPWYRGPVQLQRIDVPTGGDWLAGGTAPPFQFQPAATTGAGTLSNPGEVPAWPVYTVGAGATSFSITVNGQTTSGTLTVPTGGRLVIDTDPSAQTIVLYASDGSVTTIAYSQLSSVAFAPIPVGGSVPVTTSVAGGNGASITVAIEPRYRRAF
jgi:hypothetical protein